MPGTTENCAPRLASPDDASSLATTNTPLHLWSHVLTHEHVAHLGLPHDVSRVFRQKKSFPHRFVRSGAHALYEAGMSFIPLFERWTRIA